MLESIMDSPQWTTVEEIIFDDKRILNSHPPMCSRLPGDIRTQPETQALFLGRFGDDVYVFKDIAEKEAYFYDVVVHRVGFLRPLAHSNVTKFYGLARVASRKSSSKKVCYRVVSEYFSGGDLNAWVQESRGNDRIPHGPIKQILRDTLKGLEYLHSCAAKNGVVHCDIKPENLVFRCTKREQVVIIDFDGARIGSCAVRNERETGCYTARYAAPELFLCTAQLVKPEEVLSGKTDIWSVGCVAIELCTGEKPEVYAEIENGLWHCTTLEQIVLHVADGKGKPRIPQLDASDEDKLLKSFIMSCLCHDLQQRKTATELLNDAYLCSY